jgi:hypothetical protein
MADTLRYLEFRVATLEAALMAAPNCTAIIGPDDNTRLTLKKDGFLLRADNIALEASNKITIKAGGDLILKGAKIKEN